MFDLGFWNRFVFQKVQTTFSLIIERFIKKWTEEQSLDYAFGTFDFPL